MHEYVSHAPGFVHGVTIGEWLLYECISSTVSCLSLLFHTIAQKSTRAPGAAVDPDNDHITAGTPPSIQEVLPKIATIAHAF